MAHFVSRTRAAMLIAALLAGPAQAQSISEALVLAYGHSPDIQSALLEALIQASTAKVVATFSLLAATGRLNETTLGLPVVRVSAEPYTQTVQDVWQELRAIED
jgi:outer membrane protein